MEGNEERGRIGENGRWGREFESDGAGEVLESKSERDGKSGEAWSWEIDEDASRYC